MKPNPKARFTLLPCPHCSQAIRVTAPLEMTRCPNKDCRRWLVVDRTGANPRLKLHVVMEPEDMPRTLPRPRPRP